MSAARDKLMKRKPRPVGDPEDGVFIQALTIAELLEAQRLGKQADAELAFSAFVVSRAVVDEAGLKIFTDETDPGIQDIPTDKLADILEAATKRSKAGSLKAAEKNSEATP